jgi:hypothetical protein|tara:strand:- start:394 stop:1185 length:792 start_codon:yes stop_codon:yes gene_type:complete
MRNKIRGIQGFHHGPSKDDDPKSLNQHRSEEDLDKKLTADYATQSERGMSDAEYSKYFSEGSIHNSNLPEVDLGTVPNNNKDNNGEKSTYSKVLDGVNTSLTVGGMVPAIGAVADAGNFLFSGARTLANAVSDTASGFSTGNFNYDKTLSAAGDTAWAAAGAVPAVGIAASGGRLTSQALKAANAFKASKTASTLNKIHHLKMYQPTKAAKIFNKYKPDSPSMENTSLQNDSRIPPNQQYDTINPSFYQKELRLQDKLKNKTT